MGDAIFVFIFTLFSNVLKCKCTIFQVGNKCYIGDNHLPH